MFSKINLKKQNLNVFDVRQTHGLDVLDKALNKDKKISWKSSSETKNQTSEQLVASTAYGVRQRSSLSSKCIFVSEQKKVNFLSLLNQIFFLQFNYVFNDQIICFFDPLVWKFKIY